MQTKFTKRPNWGAMGVAAMLLAGAAQAAGVPGQGTWETTLKPHDLNADGVADAFFDTTLRVTWLRNANVSGGMTWDTANTWAAGLDVGGITGWRLPKMVDSGSPGCDYSRAGVTDCGFNVQTKSGDPTKYEPGQKVYSEMAHLYYVTLGNKGWCAPVTGTCGQPGWGLSNTGDFQGMQVAAYWSGLANALDPNYAWLFGLDGGGQVDYYLKSYERYALAVHAGNVAAVPEPQTYALMLMGVGTVMLALRRRPR